MSPVIRDAACCTRMSYAVMHACDASINNSYFSSTHFTGSLKGHIEVKMGKKKRNSDGVVKRNIIGQFDDLVQDHFWSIVSFLSVLIAVQLTPILYGTSLFNIFPFSAIFSRIQSSKDISNNPLSFAVLREAIQREGGYIHPDLGMLIPAPSGAARGLGMISNQYNSCQRYCTPGSIDESHLNPLVVNTAPPNSTLSRMMEQLQNQQNLTQNHEPIFQQEHRLIKVPLSYQMTRSLAVKTLYNLFPPDLMHQKPHVELDDAFLLTLLLAHERGLGVRSKFQPYINTLPTQPECGYLPKIRHEAQRLIQVMEELGMDVSGWPEEMTKSSERAKLMAKSLFETYGAFIARHPDFTTLESIEWALCHVASRATAGSDRHGALRLVPAVDMINHDIHSELFIEVTDTNESQITIQESELGSIYVVSMRYGKVQPLRTGQELLVDYSVPDYSALDWFISMGFVPPERQTPWIKAPGFIRENDQRSAFA